MIEFLIESLIHFLTLLFFLAPIAAVLWAIAGLWYLFFAPDDSGCIPPDRGRKKGVWWI
jgi:hypothetical protein